MTSKRNHVDRNPRDGRPPESLSVQGRFWTISNALSVSRILLMAPVLYFYLTPVHHNREYALMFVLLAATTDALDGFFARLRHEESEFGRVIDPLADKVCVGIVVVTLVVYGDIPFWFAMLILLRDVLIFAGGWILKSRRGVVLPSNIAGKFAVSFVALTVVLAMVHYRLFVLLVPYSMILTSGLLLFSLSQYAKRFFTVMKWPAQGARDS